MVLPDPVLMENVAQANENHYTSNWRGKSVARRIIEGVNWDEFSNYNDKFIVLFATNQVIQLNISN